MNIMTKIHEKTDDGWRINLVGCTEVLVQEAGTPEATQKDISLTYAMALKSQMERADMPRWPEINRAIIARWNMKALERIKKRAYDILTGKITP